MIEIAIIFLIVLFITLKINDKFTHNYPFNIIGDYNEYNYENINKELEKERYSFYYNHPVIFTGILFDKNNNYFPLFKYYNYDLNNYVYFININNKPSNITLDNPNYTIHLYDYDVEMALNNSKYNYSQSFINYVDFDNVYTNKVVNGVFRNSGIIRNQDGTFQIYELAITPRKHNFKYLVKIKEGIFYQLPVEILYDKQIIQFMDKQYKYIKSYDDSYYQEYDYNFLF